MLKKYSFLTCAVIAGLITHSAFADIDAGESSATCDASTVGVSSGSTNLEAEWEALSLNCPAGQYLEADDATCTDCPVGSYCGGGTYTFDGTDIGVSACPTGNTSAGSVALESDCYVAGTATCATVHPYSGANANKVASVTYGNANNGSAPCKTYYGSNTCTLDVADACDITAITCATGWTVLNGINLSSYATTNITTSAIGMIDASGTYSDAGTSHTQEYYGLTANGAWANETQYGIVYGTAVCSDTVGDNNAFAWDNDSSNWLKTTLSNNSGAYCWCNINGFKANSTSPKLNISSSWVLGYDYGGSDSTCATSCASACAGLVGMVEEFRAPLYNSAAVVEPTCVANSIDITWKPENGDANISNTCTYDGAVTIPAAPTRTGYNFTGWHVNNAQ